MAHGAETYAIYARQSLDQSGEGMAIARQIEDCVALGELLHLHGSPVVYADNDVTASRLKRRPEYERLMRALRAGEHHALVVWHNDRLHRRPTELEEFISVAEATNLIIHTVQAGHFDLTTPSGRMVARILGAAARQEVEHKAARRRRANKQRAVRGIRLPTGRRQFGYGRTVVEDGREVVRDHNAINRREAAAIRAAAVRLLAGESATSIYREWNAAGLATARGSEWTSARFWRVMRRPSLAGLVVYRGELVSTSGKWPAIVSKRQWRDINSLYDRTKDLRLQRQGDPSIGLFDDVAHCATCGQRLRLRVRNQLGREPGELYKCLASRAGHHAAIVVHTLDPVVLRTIVEVLAVFHSDVAAFDISAVELSKARAELERLRNKRARLINAIEDGVVAPRMVATRMAMIAAAEARIRLHRDALSAAARNQGPLGPVESQAFDFIKRVGMMSVDHWPQWFVTDHPDLETAAIQAQIERELVELEPLVLQCVARATVHVTVRGARHGRDDISRVTIAAKPTGNGRGANNANYSYDASMTKRGQVVISEYLGRIVSGEMAEGDLLPTETEMIEHYGISRTAVREGVQTLASKGFVVIKQGSGSRVAPRGKWNVLDPDYLMLTGGTAGIPENLVEAREILEPAIAGLAARNATDAQIDKLRALSHESDAKFHQAVAEASGNPILISLFASVISLHASTLDNNSDAPSAELSDHIVDAIASHDPAAAQDAMRMHLRHAHR